MNTIILLIALTLLGLAVIIFHKVKRIHIFLFDIKQQQSQLNDNLYRQLEALTGLYQTLPLKQSLPALRGWAGSPDYLLELAQQTLQKQPNTVVECGSGSSSLVIGACLKKIGKGHCYSLDHNPEFAQKTREQLEQQGLSDYVTVIDAPLTAYSIGEQDWQWYSLESLNDKQIDLLNIDGPPMDTNPLARYPALPLLHNQLAHHGLLILDDAARPDEKAIIERWQHEYSNLKTQYRPTEKGLTLAWLEGQ